MRFPAIQAGFGQLCESLCSLRRLKNLEIQVTESGFQHSKNLEWDKLLHALEGAAALESLAFVVMSNSSFCASSNA